LVESLGYPYSKEYINQYIEEVAAYVRVSTTEQKMHGISIDAQKQKLAEYAENHNMKIVEWYIDEGVSGRKPIAKRPELQRMIHDAEDGRFKRIIFIKLDRFFRSLAEYHEAMKRIEPVIWTATEEKYDLSTANGRAFVNMKLTIAELEADTGGERVRIVNDYKVKSGMPLYGAQSLPFCYTVQSGDKKSIVKQNQEIMEDAISHVMLNHSISGALVYVKNKYKTKLGYKALAKAFRNEMICGSYRGNPNYCPPYITREMFDKLQTIIERNPRTSQNEHSYIFSGLIRCPQCGNSMKGSFNVSKYGHRYYGYRCDKSAKDKNCKFRTLVFENRMEKLMLSRVEEYVEKQEVENIEISKKDKVVNKVDVEELRAELDRLNYSWQKGRIKKVEEYDKKYDALVAKIEEAESTVPEAPPDYSHIKAILSEGWEAIYKAMDNDHKKAFWRSFVKDIYINWSKEHKEIEDIKFF
jgi:DNA invertase Pin-like site-specific DNA recombinase